MFGDKEEKACIKQMGNQAAAIRLAEMALKLNSVTGGLISHGTPKRVLEDKLLALGLVFANAAKQKLEEA